MAGKIKWPIIIHSEKFKSDNFVIFVKYMQDCLREQSVQLFISTENGSIGSGFQTKAWKI